MNCELILETRECKLADRRVTELEGMIQFIHKRKKQRMNARVEREREREREREMCACPTKSFNLSLLVLELYE